MLALMMIPRTCILLLRNYHVGELSSLISIVMRLSGQLGNSLIPVERKFFC